MLTPDLLRARIAEYVDAVNSRDPQAIAAFFSEDAVQADPASNPPNVGRAAIAAFFEASIGASETWAFTATAVHTCARNVAIDFEIRLVTGGSTMTIDGIEVFTAADDGLFTSVYAYWDDADLSFA
ncbi:MAG TPA: nuclear transport factor 2 family protein [Acidimicrobiales bacterium]